MSRRPVLIAACAVLSGCAAPEDWRVFRPVTEPGDLPPPLLAERITLTAAGETASWPAGAIEDDSITLTIEDAALLSLERNQDLQIQRLTPAITATFEDIERGVFDPEFFAGGGYLESESTEVSRATGENFSTERREVTGEAGLRQTLPSGTDVEISLSNENAASNRAPEQQIARVNLTVTQALLRGAGPQVNLARIHQAELGTTASLYELQAFAESLLAETETVYWLYTLAARRIRIFEESLELARRQRDEVRERIEIGVLAETERASADAEVAQREQDLIDARAALDTLRFRLLRLVNPSPSGALNLMIEASSDPVTDPAPFDDIDDRVRLAEQQRPDLNEARLRLEQRRLETIVTRNGLLPRLDFFVALGKTGFADEFAPSFDELDGPTYDFSAGLDFSYPIGNRAARGEDRAARLSRRQAAAAVINLEQLVRRDVRVAAVEVERARRQIEASAATRALREEVERAEEERFRVGDSTSLLVAQAQRDLLESQIAEVDAIVAYRIALIDLYLAEGTLLQRRGLLLDAENATEH